jgi:mRNA interferase MazF
MNSLVVVWRTFLPILYNRKAGLAVFVPVTSQVTGSTFEVLMPPGLLVMGAVPADQLKSLDWGVRKALRICILPDETVREILQKVGVLVSADR